MLKILQGRLQQYLDCDLPEVQAGFRRGRGTRDQIANMRWIMEASREFQKKHLSWEICIWDKKQLLKLDMEQLIGSELGKEYDKAVYCLPAYLTYMQIFFKKSLLNMLEEISTTSDMQMITLWWQKVRRN